MTEAEQAFALRAYRHVNGFGAGHQEFIITGAVCATESATWLPVLRAMAAEDGALVALHVKGLKVAHFPERKRAAEAIARLTGEPATYVGLTGEKIDSADVPRKPYDDQNALLAGLTLDRFEALDLAGPPGTDADWQRTNAFNDSLGRLIDSFGDGLRKALAAEAGARGLEKKLEEAGIRFLRQ